MTISSLTDAQFKALRNRLAKIGKKRLIDRLEGEQINYDMQGKQKAVARCEASIEWVKKQPDWGN